MARQRKCVVCGDPISPDEEVIEYKGGYVHQKCFNIEMKALSQGKRERLKEDAEKKASKKKAAKPKAELKDYVSNEDYQDKKAFYEKIRSLTGEEDISSKIYVLVDKYVSRYSYTFKGMLNTINYLELKEKNLSGDIIGIIPYYYTEAEKYYEDIDSIEKNAQTKNISDMYKEKVIQIRPKQRIVKQLGFD